MYKLYKQFTSKAKQVTRDREKEAGRTIGGDAMRDGTKALEAEFAPLKLSSQVQESIKQFKVRGIIVQWKGLFDTVLYIIGVPSYHPHTM